MIGDEEVDPGSSECHQDHQPHADLERTAVGPDCEEHQRGNPDRPLRFLCERLRVWLPQREHQDRDHQHAEDLFERVVGNLADDGRANDTADHRRDQNPRRALHPRHTVFGERARRVERAGEDAHAIRPVGDRAGRPDEHERRHRDQRTTTREGVDDRRNGPNSEEQERVDQIHAGRHYRPTTAPPSTMTPCRSPAAAGAPSSS